jgi:hypothetical protein
VGLAVAEPVKPKRLFAVARRDAEASLFTGRQHHGPVLTYPLLLLGLAFRFPLPAATYLCSVSRFMTCFS